MSTRRSSCMYEGRENEVGDGGFRVEKELVNGWGVGRCLKGEFPFYSS